MPPLSPARRRWPAVAGSGLVGLSAAWFAVLNAVTAAGALPLVLHGTAVPVRVQRCVTRSDGSRSCAGRFHIAGGDFERTLVGGDRLVEGTTVRATLSGPAAEPVVGSPGQELAEASLLAGAGAIAAVVAAAGAWRGRRGVPRADGGVEGAEAGPPGDGTDEADAAEDPLAWVRRRRFGAGG